MPPRTPSRLPARMPGAPTGPPAAAGLLGADTGPDTEAFDMLLSLARGKTGKIPADVVVRHVLVVTAQADWPVTRAAMEALLRRFAFARRDELRVASRPSGASPRGLYTTRRARSDERPYVTLLDGVDPPRGSCQCPDFLRNSLGLCKHLLVVLDDLASRPGRFHPTATPRGGGETVLAWDPIRPLTGAGDPLERIRLVTGRSPAPAGAWRQVARKWFERAGSGDFVLVSAHPGQPARRLDLVRDLLRLLPSRARGGDGLSVEPALGSLLRHEKQHLERMEESVLSARDLRRALNALERKLYPYQMEGVARFLASGRLLLADDMGLGKTAQAIAAAHALFATGRVRRGLVIVPASLKEQWLREWQLFTRTPVAVVDGPPEERAAADRRQRHGVLIANYEQVLRDLGLMQAWKPDLVVLDEAQRIKNWATKTAVYVKALRPAHRLVLTGTPMENRLEELASILEWVDDQALEPKWRLAPWHSMHGDGTPEVKGARHLDTLRTRLAGSMLRRVRGEVLSQLPPRTDSLVPVALTEAQAVEHAALDPSIAQLLGIARKRPLTQPEFLRLMSLLTTQRIIANGLAQLRFQEVWPAISRLRPDEGALTGLSSPKLLELREIVGQVAVAQGRKVVIFSQWRRMLTLAHWAVGDLLAGAGLKAAFFTGQEGPRQRTRNLVEFHDDPATRLLFATDAGGVGLNLQRAANCCVNLEVPWNPAVLEQRIGRIYRLGQRDPIDVYNLMTVSSIESRIAALVSDKRAFFTGLFDGESNEVRFERSGSFLSRLERIVEPPRAPEAEAPPEAEDEAEGAIAEEIEAAVTAADESAGDSAWSEAPAAATPPTADEVRRLFSKLEIRPRPGGGIHIEAPPEAAAGLAALFEGMAHLLRRSAGG